MYHAVHPNGSLISISPETFNRQMRWLAECGYKVIKLIDLVTCIARKEELPERTIVLTFDDGLECIYTYAYPVLKEYGYPATVFLVSGFVGKTNQWHSQPEFIPVLPLLNWEQIGELMLEGFEFGAHSINHPRLDHLPKDVVEQEVFGSQRSIESKLGIKVDLFAYPYGCQNKGVYESVRKIFKGACGTNMGYATTNSDPWLIQRIDIHYFRSEFLFRNLTTSLGNIYLSMRRPLRNLRTSVYPS